MRIAVSGTHFIGKSTLIEDFIKKHPEYKTEIEPYYKLQNEKSIENSAYRKLADKYFKKIYRDDICDIFPRYNHPKVIEITGDRIARIKKLENCLVK